MHEAKQIRTPLKKKSQLKLEDGMGRPVRPSQKAIKAALRGDTSGVLLKDTECSIIWDEDYDEYRIWNGYSDPIKFHGPEELKEAIVAFLEMAMDEQ